MRAYRQGQDGKYEKLAKVAKRKDENDKWCIFSRFGLSNEPGSNLNVCL